MTEKETRYRPIINSEHLKRDLNYIGDKIDQATTVEETFKAYMLYGRLVAVHALIGISAMFDRLEPPDRPNN